MASYIARAIERALAEGNMTPRQEEIMQRRLRLVERAYEMGGDDAAERADRLFIEQEYGILSGY